MSMFMVLVVMAISPLVAHLTKPPSASSLYLNGPNWRDNVKITTTSDNSTVINNDDGWHMFYFGRSNVLANPQFTMCTNKPALLRVTDAYCSGDTFTIYLNGTKTATTAIRSDAVSGGGACEEVVMRPEEAFFSPNMSHVEIDVAPGAYGVNVLAAASPFGGGIGYLRLDSRDELLVIAGYDRHITIFSPEGRLYQVEYAFKAISNEGVMTIGLRGANCAVVMSQRKIPDKLYDTEHDTLSSRLFAITPRIGMVCAGMLPDARTLVARARQEAAAFRYHYGYDCPVDHVARRLANLAQVATQEAAMRPLAVSATVIGYDDEGARYQVHRVDPAGHYTGYWAVASGPKGQEATAFLEKAQLKERHFGADLDAVVKAGLRCMQHVLGQRIGVDEVEIGCVSDQQDDRVFTVLSAAKVSAIMDQLDRE